MSRVQGDVIAKRRQSGGVRLVDRRARLLQREQTEAEKRLWKELRARRLAGLRFRRQVPIGEFIVDFCCRRHKLIVEVDGGLHADGHGFDSWRTEMSERRGYRVMRFWNHQVLTNIEGVLETIFDCVRFGSNLVEQRSYASDRRAGAGGR